MIRYELDGGSGTDVYSGVWSPVFVCRPAFCTDAQEHDRHKMTHKNKNTTKQSNAHIIGTDLGSSFRIYEVYDLLDAD